MVCSLYSNGFDRARHDGRAELTHQGLHERIAAHVFFGLLLPRFAFRHGLRIRGLLHRADFSGDADSAPEMLAQSCRQFVDSTGGTQRFERNAQVELGRAAEVLALQQFALLGKLLDHATQRQ